MTAMVFDRVLTDEEIMALATSDSELCKLEDEEIRLADETVDQMTTEERRQMVESPARMKERPTFAINGDHPLAKGLVCSSVDRFESRMRGYSMEFRGLQALEELVAAAKATGGEHARLHEAADHVVKLFGLNDK